jgi:hypothetical protein
MCNNGKECINQLCIVRLDRLDLVCDPVRASRVRSRATGPSHCYRYQDLINLERYSHHPEPITRDHYQSLSWLHPLLPR